MGQRLPGLPQAGSSSPDLAQADSVFTPAERSVVVLLDRTHLLLKEGRYAEAVQCLDRILSGNEDYFFKPDADASVHRSIKSEARRMLGSIPPSGRQSYELQFGALARSTLENAVETGSIPMVAEVARRFFHTSAGYEATYLLGIDHMDRGRPLVAALTFRRLREESSQYNRFEPSLSLAMARSWLAAGMPENARQALDGLRNGYGDRLVTIEGREVPLFDSADDSVDWLQDSLGPNNASPAAEPTSWTVYGGSPQRIAVSKGGRPLLNARWYVPTTDHPTIEAMIDRLRRQQEERETTLLPGLHPLVVNDVVLMRTATNLLAVDFTTGKRLWEVPAEDPFEAALNPSPEGRVIPAPNLDSGLRSRLWGDGAYGTLASDGQRVFSVEDLRLPSSALYSRPPFAAGNRAWAAGVSMTTNRLAAFDIRTEGKLQWELGGPHSEKAAKMAGAFFLGPPLPLLGDLYVLAEIDGEIRLLALDAETGDLLWQQQLAVVAESVYQDTLRRVSGVSPSYADGILVCPTSHHSIVALELTTRSLLWGYSYADHEQSNQRAPNFLGSSRYRTDNPENRWLDSALVVADGCVLATPIDSDQLHCLSLDDGRLVWKVPRDDKLFIATVHEGKVVVARRKGLAAFNLEDGKPAWEASLAACPANSEPSGRGFSNGEIYYLPLTGGKLMTVRLATGKVEQIFRSRQGKTLGNLVCHAGKILSQRADGLESYYQLESLRAEISERLAAQPDDARALALRGEILWDDGRLDAAVECLRKSIQQDDSLHARSLLREVMFDGLATEFERYQAFRDEIESLIDTAHNRAKFHRLVAAGWEHASQYARALAEYRLLVDHDIQRNAIVEVDEDYSVRQDRWVRARLLHLFEVAPADVRTELLRWSDEVLQRGQLTAGPEGIGLALEYFDGLSGTRQYKAERIERLVEIDRVAEAELALMREIRTCEDGVLAERLARWTAMLMDADRPADVDSLLAKIETRWADLPFGDGQTGTHWAAGFAQQHEAVRQVRRPTNWPRGLVKTSVAETKPSGVLPSHVRGSIPFQSSSSLFCKGLVLEQQQLQIVARDGLGHVQWKFPFSQLAEPRQLAAGRNLMRVDLCGHLLIVSLGNRIVALDTIATQDDGTPKVAWSEEIEGVDTAFLQRQMYQARGRSASFFGSAGYSPRTSLVLGESLICVKRSRRCAMLDAATGRTLWERDGISTQSEVFGDDRYVLIVPRQSTKARVFRASDGVELESCTVPAEEQRLATIGRRILCWERGQQCSLKMIDPLKSVQEEIVWGPYQFPLNAKPQLVDHELISVFTPDGKFQLIRSADGTSIVDTDLKPEEPLTDVVVFCRDGQYLVIANNSVNRRDPRRRVTHTTGARRIGVAKVLAFDSEGSEMWEQPAAVENHLLPLSQPKGVPCLTFACTVQEMVRDRPAKAKADILCVDTRSGAIVVRQEFAHASQAVEITGAPEKSRVEIRMQQETLSLEFTNEPIPEGGEPEPAAAQGPSNSLEAIYRAVIGGDGPEDVPTPPARQAVPPPPLEPAIREQIPPARMVPTE